MTNSNQHQAETAAPEQPAHSARADETTPAPKSATIPHTEPETPPQTHSQQPEQAVKLSDSSVKPTVTQALKRVQRERAKRWANENRRAFRSSDDIDAIIGAECDATGCTESDAIKNLIRRAADKGRVVIQPVAHPELLLRVIAALNELARAVRGIRSRVNAPLLETGDPELMALLKDWRQQAVELPPKMSAVVVDAQKVIHAVTGLVPENVRLIRELEKQFERYIAELQEKASSAASDTERSKLGLMVKRRRALMDLLSILGIFGKSHPCHPQK